MADNYFEVCERDEQGHCLPIGQRPTIPKTEITSRLKHPTIHKKMMVNPGDLVPVQSQLDESHVQAIVLSMKKNGWVGMPLVAIDNQALNGSHRLEAAKRVGLKIPIIRVTKEEAIKGGAETGKTIPWKIYSNGKWAEILEKGGNSQASKIMQEEASRD